MKKAQWHTDGSRIYAQLNPGGQKQWIADVAADARMETRKQIAHLIAAAPELLEACKAIAVWLIAPSTDPKTILEMNTIVTTAIRKAEAK